MARINALTALLLLLSVHLVKSALQTQKEEAAKETSHYRDVVPKNLRRIAAALNQYAVEHSAMLPSWVNGPDGQPWHSWRVLLLPYLGEKELHARYRFDEPWNGPNNRKLWAEIPGVFRYPGALGDDAIRMKYLAVVSPQSVWPGPHQFKLYAANPLGFSPYDSTKMARSFNLTGGMPKL